MLLSISMIVKNEERTLHRCLSALKPLLDAIPSELIITDTGSTDNTVAIAKQFTDNIIHIEWQNDFAWARNHGLNAAKGKWFMWLDADEILQDATELIQFFQTGEYKKYRQAYYSIVNFHNGQPSSNIEILRMSERTRELQFEQRIHEKFNVQYIERHFFSQKTQFFHDGYDFAKNPDKLREKADRNRENVLKSFEDNPDNSNFLGHVIDQYNLDDVAGIEGSREKLLHHIKLGIEKYSHDNYQHTVFISRYVELKEKFYGAGRLDDLLAELSNYFFMHRPEQGNYPNLKANAGSLYFANKEYKNAAISFQDAITIWKQNKKAKFLNDLISTSISFTPYTDADIEYLTQRMNESYSLFLKEIKESARPVDALLDYVFAHDFLINNDNFHWTYLISDMAIKQLLTQRYDDATNQDLFNTFVLVRTENLRFANKKEADMDGLDKFALAVNKAYSFTGFPMVKALKRAAGTMPRLDFVMQPLIARLESDLPS